MYSEEQIISICPSRPIIVSGVNSIPENYDRLCVGAPMILPLKFPDQIWDVCLFKGLDFYTVRFLATLPMIIKKVFV